MKQWSIAAAASYMTKSLVMQLLKYLLSSGSLCFCILGICILRLSSSEIWVGAGFQTPHAWAVCVFERDLEISFWGSHCLFLRSKRRSWLKLACRVLSHELCCLVTWLYWIYLGFLIGSLWSAGPASHICFCLCSGECSCSESMKSEDSEATFLFCRQDFSKCL